MARQHPPPREPRWVRRIPAAKYAQVSRRTLDIWVAEGKIPAYKSPGGRALLFDLNEIDDVLRAGRVVPEAS